MNCSKLLTLIRALQVASAQTRLYFVVCFCPHGGVYVGRVGACGVIGSFVCHRGQAPRCGAAVRIAPRGGALICTLFECVSELAANMHILWQYRGPPLPD